MYSTAFRYLRAKSLEEAATMLSELGEDAKALAGGQSLIPLMKLRLSKPTALVDLNFIPGISQIEKRGNTIHFGALARHAQIEESEIAAQIPILHDCAAGIADVQVRNRGTIGGSLAEADPTGDWGPVLLALSTEAACSGPKSSRTIPLSEFFLDAYTTALAPGELVRDVIVKMPPRNSGGAYLAFKRCAPVYASATAAVQLTMADKDSCSEARIVLGCVGLLPILAADAEKELRGHKITSRATQSAGEAAMAAAEPQSDMRGSAEYKRVLIGSLVKRAIEIAARRARGEHVEASHEYAGRA
ncbi:MAG TPA: xanthine dehydrogenase family protein subunit M [Candidatus Acidoferrales bacterium]|nr:xanthine dehydrogenase family protein subunit M [Candidatus Acidoferrales bacterium]